MQVVRLLQTGDSTIGPLAFEGRTITLVARTTAVHVGDDSRGALHVRSRPHHVEVLDAGGRRQVVAVRNVEQAILLAIATAAAVGSIATRVLRARRRARE